MILGERPTLMVLTAWGKLWKSRVVGLTGEGHGVLDVDTDTYKRRNREYARKGILTD